MLVRYIGEEPETEAYGYTFLAGEAVEIEGRAAEKLPTNPCFEVVEAPKRGRKPALEVVAAEPEAGE